MKESSGPIDMDQLKLNCPPPLQVFIFAPRLPLMTKVIIANES